MKWTQKQMRTVGKIAYVAADRRQRLLTKDQIGWLQEKMDEIQRLAKLLPNIPYPSAVPDHEEDER